MKNLSQYLLIASVVFTFFSCHEEPERFILEGKLFDAETGEPIQGLLGFEYKDSGGSIPGFGGTGFSFYDSAELDEEGYFKLIISEKYIHKASWNLTLHPAASSNKYYYYFKNFTLSNESMNIGVKPQGALKIILEDVPEITLDSVQYVDYYISGEDGFSKENFLSGRDRNPSSATCWLYSNQDYRLQAHSSRQGIRSNDIDIDIIINLKDQKDTEFVIKH